MLTMIKTCGFRIWRCLLVFFVVSTYAQTADYYSKLFEKGKLLYSDGQYELAQECFLPLSTENKNNSYSKAATFYYGLTSLKLKNFEAALSKLSTLQLRYDTYRPDEVAYLLSNLYFENKEYDKALKQIGYIKSDKLREEAKQMKIHYLERFKDPQYLKPLFERNPKDKEIAQKLYDLCSRSQIPQWVELAGDLKKQFGFEDKQNYSGCPAKDTLRVSVLFPFALMEISFRNGGQDFKFLSDYWAGLNMACDSLSILGIPVRFYPMDVDKDTNKLLDYVNDPLAKEMDFSIGPVFSNLIDLSAIVSSKSNHYFVVPFANNLTASQLRSKIIMVQPHVNTIATNSAELAIQNGQRAFTIFYYKSYKDSLMAVMCKQKVEQMGGKVLEFTKVEKSAASVFSKSITKKSLEELDAIFLFTQEQMVATQYITALSLAGGTVKSYVPIEWLSFESLNYKQLQTLNFMFMGGMSYSYILDDYEWFDSQFKSRFGYNATEFAILGYETLMYFSLCLKQYGVCYFDKLTSGEKVMLDKDFEHFRFSNASFNLASKVYTFQDNELVEIK